MKKHKTTRKNPSRFWPVAVIVLVTLLVGTIIQAQIEVQSFEQMVADAAGKYWVETTQSIGAGMNNLIGANALRDSDNLTNQRPGTVVSFENAYIKGILEVDGALHYGTASTTMGSLEEWVVEQDFATATSTQISYLVDFGAPVYLVDAGIKLTGLATSSARMVMTTSSVAYNASAIEALMNNFGAAATLMNGIDDIAGGGNASYATNTALWLWKYPGTSADAYTPSPILIEDSSIYIQIVATSTNPGATSASGSLLDGKAYFKFRKAN